MKMDKFIEEYPMFANIRQIIDLVKTENRIYSNEIMKEVRFGADLFIMLLV